MTPRLLGRQDIDCGGLQPDTRVPVPDVDKFSNGGAYARDLSVGDRVFTASGGTTSITGMYRTSPRKVLKVTFSDRQVIRCSSGQQFEAHSPVQRVREGKLGAGGRSLRQRLAHDRTVWVYATAPVSKVIGHFSIHEIVQGTPQEIWDRFGSVGVIEHDAFFTYYEGRETAAAIVVGSAERLSDPLALDEMNPRPSVPQSFAYLPATSFPDLALA